MANTGSRRTDTSGLNTKIYMVELELQKLHAFELYRQDELLPAQRKLTKETCADLIAYLQQIITNLDTQG
jgi:hypothetical protein